VAAVTPPLLSPARTFNGFKAQIKTLNESVKEARDDREYAASLHAANMAGEMQAWKLEQDKWESRRDKWKVRGLCGGKNAIGRKKSSREEVPCVAAIDPKP
jgi:hypothetical protein